MSLEDQLDTEPAKGWKPIAGDKIVGTIVGIDERISTYGGTYPVVELETDAGRVAVHAFHTVLKKELAKLRPVAGDKLGIKYLGRDAKSGNYENYRVVLERADPSTAPAPDWDAMGADASTELAAAASATPTVGGHDDEEPF